MGLEKLLREGEEEEDEEEEDDEKEGEEAGTAAAAATMTTTTTMTTTATPSNAGHISTTVIMSVATQCWYNNSRCCPHSRATSTKFGEC